MVNCVNVDQPLEQIADEHAIGGCAFLPDQRLRSAGLDVSANMKFDLLHDGLDIFNRLPLVFTVGQFRLDVLPQIRQAFWDVVPNSGGQIKELSGLLLKPFSSKFGNPVVVLERVVRVLKGPQTGIEVVPLLLQFSHFSTCQKEE